MRKIFRLLLVLMLFALPVSMHAQEAAAKDKAPATTAAQRKKAKQKWKEQRKIEKEQKKAVKEYHKGLQDKSTLKRMRKEKRKAEKLRQNKREFFLVRWFKYRKK